jgi:hypothetical protein
VAVLRPVIGQHLLRFRRKRFTPEASPTTFERLRCSKLGCSRHAFTVQLHHFIIVSQLQRSFLGSNDS